MYSFLRSKTATVILGILAVWLLMLAVASGIRRHSATAEQSALWMRIEDAKRENARLADELDRMQRPQWLALLARQRLNYKQSDETVVFVYKSEKAGTIAQPHASQESPEPSWRLWMDWFRGR
jgi:cell division protein FtsB